jgi:hypothetical protein
MPTDILAAALRFLGRDAVADDPGALRTALKDLVEAGGEDVQPAVRPSSPRPDRWSLMLGQVAVHSFILVLISRVGPDVLL